VVRALDAIDPAIVLIEGPPEADDLLPLAASPAMRPPLAILAYLADDPSLAVFFPLADYSPEWQAILWAHRHRRPVRFFDLPVGVRLAEMRAQKAAQRPDEAGEGAPAQPDAAPPEAPADPIQAAIRADPIGSAGRLAGYEEGEGWWNALIEQGAPAADIFAGIERLMTELRERADSAADPSDAAASTEARREAHMRLAIADAAREHDGPIAAVTGAWHVPALRRKVRTADDRALLRGIDKAKAALTFIPWTDTRLAAGSGYGAGVISPGWYRHLWDEFSRAGGLPLDPRRLTAGWQSRVGALLRDSGLAAPTAAIIEAARLAESLAALRGIALPGLAEMRDAALATLCGGEAAALSLVETRLVIGSAVGEIDAAAPQMPLQADLTRLQRQCRLKPSTDEEELSIDLRTDNGLARSTLLHRLSLIGVAWGRLIDAGKSRGTFRERWRIAWAPELSVRLAEALVWGTTVADASASRARSLVADSQDAKVLAEVIAGALVADLPDVVEIAIGRLQAVAALSSDPAPLVEAVPPLANLLRYGEARKVPEAELGSLLRHLCLEVSTGIARNCRGLEPDAAEAMRNRIVAFERALPLIRHEIVGQAWQEALARLASDEMVVAPLRGHAARRLHELAVVSPDETARHLSLALSHAQPPAEAGAWIAGFLGDNGEILIVDHGLRTIVDDWLAGLAEADFIELLPLLRRVLGSFDRMQRRRLMDELKPGARGGDPAGAGDDAAGAEAFARALPLLFTILGLKP